MDKEQEAKFDKWIGREIIFSTHPSDVAHEGWQACLEANGIGEEPRIPDGYFKIGEEAECLFREETKRLGKFGFISSDCGKVCFDPAVTIRRIPAWKPKDGEAVFALFEGKAIVARIIGIGGDYLVIDYDGRIGMHKVSYKGHKIYAKPFDASKIGKPWSEI